MAPALTRALPFTASGALTTPTGSDVRCIHGWSIAETAGKKARLRIRDGDNNGEIIASLTLEPDQSICDLSPDPALDITTGTVYVDVVSGSVEGAIWTSLRWVSG